VWWHGRWYVVGHDTGRDDVRVFRLSRIVGSATALGQPGSVKAPPDTDLRALVARMAGDDPTTTATVRVRPGAAWALRREATATAAGPDGWDRLSLGYSDPERFADRVAGYGADAVVESPIEAREAVVRRLKALVAT
jgi:proteasome accessory factor B